MTQNYSSPVLVAVALSAILAVVALGCASPKAARRVGIQDSALDSPSMTTDIESKDIRRMTERIVESLLSSQSILSYTKGELPVLDIAPIKNKTGTDVDMDGIADFIRTRLTRSNMFRFVDRSAARMAMPAQMYLTGSLVDEVKSTWKISSPFKKFMDHSYKFSMSLKDISTGEVVWSDECEIRKEANLPLWE